MIRSEAQSSTDREGIVKESVKCPTKQIRRGSGYGKRALDIETISGLTITAT